VPLVLHGRGLTPRERELVARVLQGASTKTLARELGISPNTVQDHLKAIFAKTGLHSRRELVAFLLGPHGPTSGSGPAVRGFRG
jgi:DNA-binding CsgD family transcriptional regulator